MSKLINGKSNSASQTPGVGNNIICYYVTSYLCLLSLQLCYYNIEHIHEVSTIWAPCVRGCGLCYLWHEIKCWQCVGLRKNARFATSSYSWCLEVDWVNTLSPRQYGRHFADDIFKCIFLNENVWILPKISLKFVPKVRIDKITAVVQIMACRRPGDKPLSEPMMINLLTHICVTRPQWVKPYYGV